MASDYHIASFDDIAGWQLHYYRWCYQIDKNDARARTYFARVV